MSDYELPAEMVEALAKELHEAFLVARDSAPEWDGLTDASKVGMRAEARFVLRRQHERERRLLAGIVRAQEWLSVGSMDTAQHELSETRVWYNKLDAPKVPTLADAVEQIERECPGRVIATLKDSQAWTIIKLAAVEREEKREKR